jgi:hypothetical protein
MRDKGAINRGHNSFVSAFCARGRNYRTKLAVLRAGCPKSGSKFCRELALEQSALSTQAYSQHQREPESAGYQGD